MPYKHDLELAKEKMLKAENALENYLLSTVDGCVIYDSERAKQLISAATVAREEYIDWLAFLGPTPQ